MLDLIGLKNFKDDYPGQLSGGMAQRVALVRTLINEPPILLLDEPLGALDAFTRMNMQDEILSAWRGRNQLAVMVTHDVDEAIYMGTRVIVMEPSPGRIKADIPIKLDYPRNRSSAQFIEYRNQILEMLNYGVKRNSSLLNFAEIINSYKRSKGSNEEFKKADLCPAGIRNDAVDGSLRR